MRTEFSPWSRGALGADNLRRLRLHLAGGYQLQVTGASPARFTVRLHGDGTLAHRYDVARAVLWPTIVAMLAAAGRPLPSDEEWAEFTAELERA